MCYFLSRILNKYVITIMQCCSFPEMRRCLPSLPPGIPAPGPARSGEWPKLERSEERRGNGRYMYIYIYICIDI